MISEKIFSRKILVCCGSGGVGKTTTAAALGVQAALHGKRTIVLTIDPAKRLATAMGLTDLSYEPKRIPLKGGSGELFAMMLDTKRTFDRLIERYSSNKQAKDSIFKNRLYQYMSNMIAGSQEYMAMEKLYEVFQEGEYDLLILDTPPTRHALDFLEAPQRMINLTGNSLLKWFLKPSLFVGRVGFGALGKGAEKIMSAFDRLAGLGFLQELSEMISLISDLLGGFHERAQSVHNLLRKEGVGFLLISSPSSVSIQDALYFHEKIEEYQLPFLGFIVNRLHQSGINVREKDLSALSPHLKEKILQQLKNYQLLSQRDEGGLRLLKKMGRKASFYTTVPLFTQDIHDLQGLQELGEALLKPL